MIRSFLACSALMLSMLLCNEAKAQITKIWLTHQSDDPSGIVISWYSNEPGNSEVYVRIGTGKERRIAKKENTRLHHVVVPLKEKDVDYHYRVKSGDQVSATYTFKGYPSNANELRVAVVGNWGFAESPDMSQLHEDDPHLLVTLGDNISGIHELCGEAKEACIDPYLNLIESELALFRSTPFMPILGNHDKEIRPRGIKYPPLAVYDTNATAYRTFFELPGEEWVWKFAIPDFNLSFVALDLNHLPDIGTTWQTCRSFRKNAEQFVWYQKKMNTTSGITITLMNERSQLMRKVEDEEWKKLLEKGTAVISGFGYYSEYAEVNGFPYFNTSLKAGDQYPDPFSKFLKGVGGYMLLRLRNNESPVFEMKSLDGTIMNTFVISPE